MHEQHPSKRQKTDSSIVSVSPTTYRNKDTSGTSSRLYERASSAKSGPSQTLNGATNRERNHVERYANPHLGHSHTRSERKRQSQGSQDSNGTAKNSLLREKTSSGKTVIRDRLYPNFGDRDDPISDDEDVQIKSPTVSIVNSNPAQPRIPYNGNARPEIARQSNTNARSKAALPPESTSRFFENGADKNFGAQDSVDELADSGNELSEQIGRTERKGLSRGLGAKSSNGRDRKSAKDVRQLQLDENNTSLATRTGTFYDLRNSSEDDLNAPNDITSTSFPKSKQQPHRKKPVSGEYEVLEVFSQSQIWLSEDNKKKLALLFLNSDSMLLTIAGEGIANLTTNLRSLKRIIWNKGNPRINIHKAADSTLGGASQLFVLLRDGAQSERLVNHITDLTPVDLILKPGNDGLYLEAVFENVKVKVREARPKPGEQSDRVPDDVYHLQEKQSKRQNAMFDKAIESKCSNRGSRMREKLERDDERSGLVPPSIQRLRSTRSSSNLQNSEDDQREVPPNGFYGSLRDNRPRLSARNTARTSPVRKARSLSPERWSKMPENRERMNDWKSSVVYPPGGKKAATVDKQDIERLDEGQFLNDNLIFFYLRWLEEHLPEEKKNRIYFQNTFFFERLATSGKGLGINYDAVRRWTSKIRLIDFDYIIVPVNEHTHWYVAIICNPSSLIPKESRKNPEIQELALELAPGEGQTTSVTTDLRQSTPSSSSPAESASANLPDPGVEGYLQSMSLQDKSVEDNKLIADTNNDERSDEDYSPPYSKLSRPIVNGNLIEEAKSNTIDLENSESEIVTPNLMQAPEKTHEKASRPKRGKRKSATLTAQKYDPKDPRIITLDSLGGTHSPCCTRLKNYLVAEIKDKHYVDIPIPGSIGMSASSASIPQQDNHCDCGLFLLSYVEAFLKCPDKFIEDIQLRRTLDCEFIKAPDMRNRIRELLFRYQETQKAADKQARDAKAKARKASKAESKEAPQTKTSQAYNCTQNSPSPKPKHAEDEQADVSQPILEEKLPGNPSPCKESASIDLDDIAQNPASGRDSPQINAKIPFNDYDLEVAGKGHTVSHPPPRVDDIQPLSSNSSAQSTQDVKTQATPPGPKRFFPNLFSSLGFTSKAKKESIAARGKGLEADIVVAPDSNRMVLEHLSPSKSQITPRNLMTSPSPEIVSSGSRRRRRSPTPHPRNSHNNGDTRAGSDDSVTSDIEKFMPDTPMSKAPYREDDDEMLLSNGGNLTSQQLSSPDSESPLSNPSRSVDLTQHISTPPLGRKRKNTGDLRESEERARMYRDSSDKSLIGVGPRAMKQATHIRFNDC
jgi:sentrin-specific protease 7